MAVALEDLDRRRLAGAVRSEQAEDLAGFDREVDSPESFLRRRSVLRSPRTETALTARPRATRARGEPASRAGEREDDLAAVGLVPDDHDRLASALDRRAQSSPSAPGARRSSASGVSPAARAIGSAVSRARSSGLETTASGCSAFEPLADRSCDGASRRGQRAQLVRLAGRCFGVAHEEETHAA